MQQLTNDFYLVLVDQLFESRTTNSGLISSNTAIINPTTEERSEFKRRYGKVLAVPLNFTNNHVSMVDPGSPAPRKYISHEWIEYMRQWGHRQGVRPYDAKVYYPSTFEKYDVITCADLGKKMDVEVGDKIYFNESCTEDERFMGKYQGKLMYSIRVDEIQAIVRTSPVFEGYSKFKRSKVIMQGGWVIVKIDMETWEEISVPIPGQAVPLIVKSAPEAKPLRGWIKEIDNRPDLKRGDHIIFERDADAPCMFEGEELVIMKDEDILAKIQPKIKKL
jgi:co-chaperonin GroES (HSP10)